MINGTRYQLVYVVLTNQSHFRGVAVISDQYVLYDGMLAKMRYIHGSESFSKDGRYNVGSLWYRKIHSWSPKIKAKVKPHVELQTEKRSSKQNSSDKQNLSSTKKPRSYKGVTKMPAVKVKIEAEDIKGKDKKVPPPKRTPSKRHRVENVKWSPSQPDSPAHKRKRYPIGISIATTGSSFGIQPKCKWCRGTIMRTQCRAIKKVKRDVGMGFDTSQIHLYCAKKALLPNELQQLLDVIAATPNAEAGFRSAWAASVSKEKGKTPWDHVNEMRKK